MMYIYIYIYICELSCGTARASGRLKGAHSVVLPRTVCLLLQGADQPCYAASASHALAHLRTCAPAYRRTPMEDDEIRRILRCPELPITRQSLGD